MNSKLLFFYFAVCFIVSVLCKKKRSSGKNGLPAIRKVYVINLDKRPDRMKAISIVLKDLKIPFERFEAFDFGNGSSLALKKAYSRFYPGTKFNSTLVQQYLDLNGNDHKTWGSAGCWQSHLQVYMKIVAENIPGPYLVLEDDIKISPKITTFLSHENMFEKLPQDWDVLLLDHYFLRCHEDKDVPKGLCKVKHAFTTSGYVLRNVQVVQKFIQNGNSAGFQVADHYWNDMFEKKELVSYTTFGKIVMQAMDEFPSDIKQSQDDLKKVFEEYKAGV